MKVLFRLEESNARALPELLKNNIGICREMYGNRMECLLTGVDARGIGETTPIATGNARVDALVYRVVSEVLEQIMAWHPPQKVQPVRKARRAPSSKSPRPRPHKSRHDHRGKQS